MANQSDGFPVCGGQDLEAGLEQVMAQVLAAPKITDRAAAFAVNVEFDRIRDALMEQRQVWESCMGLYWKRKYHCYLQVLEALDDSLREEFRFRMQQEFRRAMQLGQLNREDFDPGQWRTISQWGTSATGKLGEIPIVRRIAACLPKGVKTGLVKSIQLAVKVKRQLVER